MRFTALALLLVAWAGVGCWSLLGTVPSLPPESAPAEVESALKKPVSAEQITEMNARRKAQALREELDREFDGE